MGFKRRRDQHDFRPRASPGEEALLKSRSEIAHIGEPSRFAREGRMRNLLHGLSKVPEEFYPQLLETLRAVIYEQPHKIGYLGHVLSAAPESLTFYVVEMAQDESVKSLNDQDWPRFKLYFRFLCAMHSVISNTEVLVECLDKLLEETGRLASDPARVNVAEQSYKTALLASLYLPRELVSGELREKFVGITFSVPTSSSYEVFRGEERPYEPRRVCDLLVESANSLKENDWDAQISARNPSEPIRNNENENKEDVQMDTSVTNPTDNLDTTSQEHKTAEGNAIEQAPDKSNVVGEEIASENPESEDAEKTSNEPAEQPPKKHTIHAIHLPEIKQGPSPLAMDFHFRCYLPIDGVETMPTDSNVAGLLLRDVAIDNIQHMDFNRREVVRQSIVLDEFFSRDVFATPGIWIDQLLKESKESPEKPTWKIEDVASEAIFSQMFDLSRPSALKFPNVYYHTQLIEACIIAPQDVAPVLGRGLRFLFNNLITADAEILFRMVDWFAHHVSNFAFTWKWNEWLDTLKLPETHPQQIFIRELSAKQVRLSYPQRIRDVLPAEFQGLVPNPPDVPGFKYENDEVANELLQALRDSASSEHKSAPSDDNYDPEKDVSSESAPEQILRKADNPTDLLVHSICHLGNRSVTHATTWIHKAEKLISEFCTDKAQIVASVFDYWKQSAWVGALVLEQFVKSNFITVGDIIRYIFSNQDLLLSSVGWEQLSRDAATALEALKSSNIEGDYSIWWKERLETALDRISKQDAWAVEYKDFMKSLVAEKSKVEDEPKTVELPLLTAKKAERAEVKAASDVELKETPEKENDEESEASAPKRVKTE